MDLVVDVVHVVDVSVSEFVLPPASERLSFSSSIYAPGRIVSSPIVLLHKVFLSFLIRQRMELTLGMSFCPSFALVCQKSVNAES